MRHPRSRRRRSLGRRTWVRALATAALVCATAAATACASAGPATVLPTSGDRFFVAGYHAYWTGDAWRSYPWDTLHRLYLFEIEIGSDGRVADAHGWPEAWTEVLAEARAAGVSIVPTISMHDARAFEEVFASPERIASLVDQVTALLAADPTLDGVHLDFEVFEPVPDAVRDGYTAFVARLSERLDALDPALSLSVFAMAFDEGDVYDERALGALADYLVVQGYDFHHAQGERAGPLGATRGWGVLNWGSVLERYLALDVPRRKIVMAVPLYGYEWPVASDAPGADATGAAVIIPLAAAPDVMPELPRARSRAAEHGQRRDRESGVPYYAYRDVVGWRQGWYEDAESLRAKYAFVREHGLGGVALFPLAYGDRSVWDDLRSALSAPRAGTAEAPTR